MRKDSGRKDRTISADVVPHPIAAAATQRRGGKSLETMVAGTWKMILRFVSGTRRRESDGSYVGKEKGRVDPVKQLAVRVSP